MRSQHNPNRRQLPQFLFFFFVHVAIDDVWVIAGLRIQGEKHPTGQRIGQRCFRGHRLFGVGERCVLQGETSFWKEKGEVLSNKVPRSRLCRVGAAGGKIEKASFKSKTKIVGFSFRFLRNRVFFYRKASEATGDHERRQKLSVELKKCWCKNCSFKCSEKVALRSWSFGKGEGLNYASIAKGIASNFRILIIKTRQAKQEDLQIKNWKAFDSRFAFDAFR